MTIFNGAIPNLSTLDGTRAPSPQNHGEVFTRRWVVETILDLCGYTADRDLGALRLIEPSCGSGAFLGVIIERLVESASTFDRPLMDLDSALRSFDIQPQHVEASRSLATRALIDAGVKSANASDLAAVWIRCADFLLPGHTDEFGQGDEATVEARADLVVGNPPYIRYDDLDDLTVEQYRRTWSTMSGRGDIYVGFFERSLRLLKPGGKVGFICADRWMRNQYGAKLRELVTTEYAVEHIWTMHNVDAFEEQVSAYPAITVLSRKPQSDVLVADTTERFGAESAAELVEASNDAVTTFSSVGVQAHRLGSWYDGSDLWPTGTPARLALIEHLNANFAPLHDLATGTKVSIGVATGADKVYVTNDPSVAELDRMLPLAMRRDLMTGTFDWQGNYLVNPWDDSGGLVDLNDFPRMAGYLRAAPGLTKRHVAKKSPSGWYRTIDKVQPGLTDRPKLLLQDMKATIHPVLEPGGFYPHHNLYYVISDKWDLEVLGGLLLSRVAQAFIEAYCVRMRGGTLRFQAQYLKRIRVPQPGQINSELQHALRFAFRARDVDEATKAACAAYGISADKYELNA